MAGLDPLSASQPPILMILLYASLKIKCMFHKKLVIRVPFPVNAIFSGYKRSYKKPRNCLLCSFANVNYFCSNKMLHWILWINMWYTYFLRTTNYFNICISFHVCPFMSHKPWLNEKMWWTCACCGLWKKHDSCTIHRIVFWGPFCLRDLNGIRAWQVTRCTTGCTLLPDAIMN